MALIAIVTIFLNFGYDMLHSSNPDLASVFDHHTQHLTILTAAFMVALLWRRHRRLQETAHMLDQTREQYETISEENCCLHLKLENSNVLDTILESFPGGICAYDCQNRLRFANQQFYELTGLSNAPIKVGSDLEDLIRSLLYARTDMTLKQKQRLEAEIVNYWLKETGRQQIKTLRIRLQDDRLVHIKSWPIDDGGLVASFSDITEQQNTLANLKQKQQEAEQVAAELAEARDAQMRTHEHLINSVNSMRNGFAIWNSDNTLVMTNEAYRSYNEPIRDILVEGLRFEDMIRACHAAGVWESDVMDCETYIASRLQDRATSDEHEHELPLKDGTQLIVTEKKLENGEIITTYTDVTAHRAREEELKRTKKALEQLAYFDSLTKLPNRTRYQQDLEARFDDTRKDNRFALVQIDLDNFKRVNDTQGHAAGDRLLQEMGARFAFLSQKVPCFKPYRWGGDEFIAIVADDPDVSLDCLCQELTDLIAVPVEYRDSNLWPTASLGIARYPDDASDLESLMIYADLALYRTKQLGRDGYQFFSSTMKEKVDSDLKIQTDIREALALDQFELYFQPQISSADESVTGIEALLRWNHPAHGLLPPGSFMDVVDNYGLASQLGRMVFDKAMQAAKRWTDEGIGFGRLAINLSPHHFAKNTLLEDFLASLDHNQIRPELLSVEFLESFFLDDANKDVINIMNALNARGVHVELDDFGTGYASLAHLSNLPVDGVKIDRSFVDNIANDPKQQAIVEVVMSMSKLMQLRVVCEGIETAEQLQVVSKIANCSLQGYLISRPMTEAKITKWLQEERNIGLLNRCSLSDQLPGGQALCKAENQIGTQAIAAPDQIL